MTALPNRDVQDVVAQPPGRGALVSARVAVADDDPESLELMVRSLRSATTQIFPACNGAELVRLLAEQGPFDLVVTDIDMPWMEGLAVLRSARASAIATPVLVVTGLERPGLAAAVAALGRGRLLHKPIAISDLREAVNALLAPRAAGHGGPGEPGGPYSRG